MRIRGMKEMELVRATRAAAEANPNKTVDSNKGCIYFYESNGSPCCVVGNGMHRLGMTWKRFKAEVGREKNTTGIGAARLDDTLQEGDSFTPGNSDASKWLNAVQCMQDLGNPWGKAVKWADAKYGRPEDNES